MDLENLYRQYADGNTPMGPHLDVLRGYAQGARRIVEFGTGDGVATTALLAAQPESLATYDVAECPFATNVLQGLAGATHFTVQRASSLDIAPVQCDLLFIDTVHTGRQLWQELKRHAAGVSRWIAMHDTFGFAMWDDWMDEPGLWPAVWKFLTTQPHWQVVYCTQRSWGFTVLQNLLTVHNHPG